MTNSIIPINNITHRNLRVLQDATYPHVKNQQFSFIQAHEFTHAASFYPIVFIKDSETGDLRPIALFGLAENENLFFNNEGWKNYCPKYIRSHPFTLRVNDSNSPMICINMESALVNDTIGERLFNDSGEDSEYLSGVKEFLSIFTSQTPATLAFSQYLADKKLLTSASFSVESPAEGYQPISLKGFYTIDSNALHSLSDSDFIELKNRGYLAPIYAHLLSLNLMSSLAERKFGHPAK